MNGKKTFLALAAATSLLLASVAVAHDDEKDESEGEAREADEMMQGGMMQSQIMTMPGMDNLMMPQMDPSRGKALYVTKGCVACHAINGIGGHDAPNLDAHTMAPMMNPFEFAARMWNHAPGMIAAQEEALGEMIQFTGEELADIIAFIHHDETQHGFSERNLTPMARKMMEHEHGGMPAPDSHAEEIGHGHAEGEGHDMIEGQ